MTKTAFSTIHLKPPMLKNLASLGYTGMAPIQAHTLPLILAGKDVIAKAKIEVSLSDGTPLPLSRTDCGHECPVAPAPSRRLVTSSASILTATSSYPERRSNCLYYREGSCGACIARCPVGALSCNGHDKNICRGYVYGTVPKAVNEQYGVTASGCGLCQTNVPCEGRIPAGLQIKTN